MKILALNPPFMKKYSRQSRSPCVTKGGTFYMPYFLSYAVGTLEKNKFDVKLVDAVANEWSHSDALKFVQDFKPELVILDTSTPSIYNDVEFASKVKSVIPDSHITLVGTHPTRATEETFGLSKSIDSICRGEYDYIVVDLAESLEENKSLNNVKGLSFRENGNIINNKNRELIENLDDLPFVSEVYKKHFGMEGIKKYFYASLKWPQVTILTARGCPYNCSFCNIPFKSSYRSRSPENVIQEFEYIKRELPEVKEVMIEDDTFPASKERTMKICNLLIDKKIKIEWSCNARVNTDLEILNKMKEAGCRLLCVGFETPTQEVLDKIHKKTTRELQMSFMKDTKKAGLLVNGCMILGLPGDTKDTVKQSIKFSKKLSPDTMQFYSPYAYPRTELWQWAKDNGYLITEDYSKLLTKDGQHLSNVSQPGLSNIEATELCSKALRQFYLRPGYIFPKFIQMIKNFDEAKRTFISAKTFLKHIFKAKSLMPS